MDKCKHIVHSGNLGIITRRCSRNAIKDDHCWQHHSESVKKREQIAEKRLANKPFYMIY